MIICMICIGPNIMQNYLNDGFNMPFTILVSKCLKKWFQYIGVTQTMSVLPAIQPAFYEVWVNFCTLHSFVNGC